MDGTRKASAGKFDKPHSRRKTSRLRIDIISRIVCLLLAPFFLLLFTLSSGCGNKFFDPTQVGRFRPVPAVNVILDSLGVAEETPVAWEQAEEPMPIDTVAIESDYVFRAGDVISVAIFELLQEGIQFVNNYVVTETGKISIPEVGVIEAAGLTEKQLEEEIKQILSPNILKNPSVIVTLSASQQRAFSILGDGVPLPGRYPIPRFNFRLTDALATAGGPRQFNVSYIYVSRFNDGNNGKIREAIKPGFDELELKVIEPETTMSSQRMQRIDSPRAQYRYQWPESKVVIASSEMARDDDWQAAGMPQTFQWPTNHNSGQIYTKNQSQSPARETSSVNDILKSQEQRSISEQIWLNGQINVENAMESFRQLASSESRFGALNNQDSRAFNPAPENSDEPVSVRDILKTLQERSRRQQKWLGGEVDIDNAKESLQEMARSNTWTNQRINQQVLASSAPVNPEVTNEQLESKETGHIEWKFVDGKWIPVQTDSKIPPETSKTPPTIQAPAPIEEKEEPGHVEWIFKNGKWVPVQVGKPALPKPPEPVKPFIEIEPGEKTTGPFEMSVVQQESGTGTRLIKIPADKLLAGDSRYNIVIKPGDTIHVPVDVVGEFCITGHVNRPGYFNMTGRPMTLKMAIAAAGGLGPLAWPKKVEVVRRIGKKQEEIVMLDLDKIASGEQPDIFIKPNDLINVGTHATSRWRAILRNAFRATYGFGFVYDRNFADRDFGTHRPFPGLF